MAARASRQRHRRRPSAEAVCTGEGLTRSEVTEAVIELADRSSLISASRPRGMRYGLLESIREYGLRMLQASADLESAVSEAVQRSRPLDWCVTVADQFDREWFGPGQHQWLERRHSGQHPRFLVGSERLEVDIRCGA